MGPGATGAADGTSSPSTTKLLLLDSLLQEKSRIKELIMSDVEGDDVPSAAPVASGPMDINTAIQEVLKQALIGDGLARPSPISACFSTSWMAVLMSMGPEATGAADGTSSPSTS